MTSRDPGTGPATGSDAGDAWSDVTNSPGGWRAWSDVTRSDDRWSDDPVGWAMPMVCARHLRRAAAWMGAAAALGGALASLVLVVALWLVQASTTGSPTAAMRAGILLFLGAQHGGVTISGDTVRFVPLGLVALAAVLPWRAGRALAGLADDRGQRSRLRPAFVRLVAAYTAAVAVLALVGRLGTSHAEFVATIGAGAVLAAVVAGLGVRVELCRRDDVPLVPTRWRDTARAAGAAALVSTAMSALLVAVSLAWHGGRVVDLSAAIGGGLSGVPVLLVGVLSAPNAVVAVSSLLAGPGFAVGTDTVVRVTGSHSGLLPSVPLLGALPDGGGVHPVVVVWAALTLLLTGLAVHRVLGRSASVVDALRRHLLVAVLAGVGMALAALLAGGGLGTGRLRAVGASPWQAGLAFAAVVLVAGLLVAGVRAAAGLAKVEDAPFELAPVSVVDTVVVVPVTAGVADAAEVVVAAGDAGAVNTVDDDDTLTDDDTSTDDDADVEVDPAADATADAEVGEHPGDPDGDDRADDGVRADGAVAGAGDERDEDDDLARGA